MVDPSLAATATFGPFAIGSPIAGRHELRAPLGEGGMGAVYKVPDRELEKALRRNPLMADAHFVVAGVLATGRGKISPSGGASR